MKIYIYLFVGFCLLASTARAGNANGCSSGNCYPPALRPNLNGTSSSTKARKAVSVSNNAYFNLRQKTAPPQLTLRSAAPISITEQNMLDLMAVGRIEHQSMFYETRSLNMDIGIADNTNTQTWTLPSSPLLTPDLDVSRYFIAPSSVTPAAAQVADVTHVSYINTVDENNQPVTAYRHYKMVTGDELEELGTTYVNNGMVANYSEPVQIYTDAPLDLGDAFSTSVTTHDDDDEYPKTTANSDVVVDAFGTITTPFGNTYQCLRLSLKRVQTRYTDASTSTTETQYMVAWVTPEGFRFYGVKPSQNASGSTTLNYLDMSYFTSAALEVELLTFEGKQNNNSVDLMWTTASEKTNAGFEIERSADGKTFEKIGFVKGNGTTNSKRSYTFNDNTPLSILTYYRLRQVDFDGTSTISNIIAVQPKVDNKGFKVYPNPSSGHHISIEMNDQIEEVSIVNAVGQIVFQQKTKEQNALNVDVSAWAKGIYLVKSGSEVLKFVKD
jgi:Secretion system C-terminal sorting domain